VRLRRWEALPARDFVFALEELPISGSIHAKKAVVACGCVPGWYRAMWAAKWLFL